jgi:hypothetical protein
MRGLCYLKSHNPYMHLAGHGHMTKTRASPTLARADVQLPPVLQLSNYVLRPYDRPESE